MWEAEKLLYLNTMVQVYSSHQGAANNYTITALYSGHPPLYSHHYLLENP